MTPNPADVAVVTVTYGDRADLVKRVIESALAQGVGRCIVVDNASVPESAVALRELETLQNGRVVLLRNEANAGSAGGFSQGIEAAFAFAETRAVWLLDDDNVAHDGALAALLAEAGRRTGRPVALSCVRRERRYLWEVAHGVPASRAFPPRSSFLGFRALELFAKVWRHRTGRERVSPGARSVESVTIPFAPYGGLYLPREIQAAIGLPDASFFLYADDNDYTARIARAGYELRLVPGAELEDVDESWNATGAAKNSIDRLLDMEDPQRLRYAVRNQMVFESRHWTDSRWAHALNRRVYLLLLALAAKDTRRRRNYDIVKSAVREAFDILAAERTQ